MPKVVTKQPTICREAQKHYQQWYEKEHDNINDAYDDLEFRAGNQWPRQVIIERVAEGRPIMTRNRLPQFVRQVTGDMRQARPSVKVVPVDSSGDKQTADVLAGLIRYIENRSDAQAIYTTAADSQVVAGIGHWKIISEYAADTTFNQELRIVGVSDSIAVAWDPDSILPTREDALWCIVPFDISRETFQEQWPDCPIEDFEALPAATNTGAAYASWYSKDMVRIAEYWKKTPTKRKLELSPDGTIRDLTDQDEDDQPTPGARIEMRDGYKVTRYLITAAHLLEQSDWVGRNIPVVPALGEEIRIGRRTVRHGLLRFAKDAQRAYNYFSTAHTEVVGLQPKAPFIGTEKNFQEYEEMWATANRKNYPYLRYRPDPANGGRAPERVAPPVSSQGIIEGISLANEDMKGIIGIYDASLGAKGNETSGRAILARQREGDVGSFVYIDNFNRAIRRTGVILVDLIPHIYDTERQIRIMGEDGHVELQWINRSVGMGESNPQTGEMMAPGSKVNDVTVGAYDVIMDIGPSYTTKLAEARDGMSDFIKNAPEVAPAVIDLVAKSQQWPLADEFAERLQAIAPPPVQALIHKKQQEQGTPQPPPTQQEQMQGQLQQQQLQMQMQAAQLDLENKQLTNDKIRADIAAEISQMQAQQAPNMVAALEQPPSPQDQQNMAIAHQQLMNDQELHAHKVQGAAIDNQMKHAQLMRTHAEMINQGMMSPDGQINAPPAPPEQTPQTFDALMGVLQALQQTMASIAQSQEQLAVAINEPKVVVRDARNQIVGVKAATTNGSGVVH